MAPRIDHDAVFKVLLQEFFAEFLELFAPALAVQLDRSELTFLATESFVELIDPDRRNADLVVRARLRDQPTTILIHLEHQAQNDPTLHRRMLRYFARFYDRYDTPIYPIALCSYRSPLTPPAAVHRVVIPPVTVLEFNFQVVQLSRLRWRDYLTSTNPMAVALMARMAFTRAERWRVKAACLRRAVGLPLSPSARRLIAQFVDIYTPLTGPEERAFQAELGALAPAEREEIMEIVTSWERKGRAEGRAEGAVVQARTVALRLATKKLGPLSEQQRVQIQALTTAQLEELILALLDMTTMQDLNAWLAQTSRAVIPTAPLTPDAAQ